MSKRKLVHDKRSPINTVTKVTQVCQNPNKKCVNTDIFGYIKGVLFGLPKGSGELAICEECWGDLAEKESWEQEKTK